MMRFNAKSGYVASRRFARVFVLLMMVAFSPWAKGQLNPINELFSERPIPGGAGKPDAALNANVWSCRAPDDKISVVEFLADGTARFDGDGGGVSTCKWSQENNAIVANGSRWSLSADKTWLLQEGERRVWYRGAVPPPPDPRLTVTLSIDGGRWTVDAGDAVYVFQTDGSFSEEGVRYTPKGVWQPWYGRVVCLRYTSGRACLAHVSEDGKSFLREDGNVYRKRAVLKGDAAKPPAKNASPVVASAAQTREKVIPHNRSPFAGTEWSFRALSGKTETLSFLVNGSGSYDNGTTRVKLSWSPSNEREATGEWEKSGKQTFTILPEGGQMTQRWTTKDNKISYCLWYKGVQPPPPSPLVVDAVADETILWYKESNKSSYQFNLDSTLVVKWGQHGKQTGKWMPWYGNVIRIEANSDHRIDLFALTGNGTELWRSREGDVPWIRKAKNNKGSAAPVKTTTAAAVPTGAIQTSVRAEFEATEQKYAETFNTVLEQANARDTATLEALKKRVGVSDLDLLQKISAAQAAVAQCVAIAYVAPQRASAAEKDLARIKTTRDRAISDATRAAFSRLKPAYAECLRKAVDADDIELAKGIKARMDAIGQ